MIRVTSVYEGYEFIIEVIEVKFKGDGLRYKICFVRSVDLWGEGAW